MWVNICEGRLLPHSLQINPQLNNFWICQYDKLNSFKHILRANLQNISPKYTHYFMSWQLQHYNFKDFANSHSKYGSKHFSFQIFIYDNHVLVIRHSNEIFSCLNEFLRFHLYQIYFYCILSLEFSLFSPISLSHMELEVNDIIEIYTTSSSWQIYTPEHNFSICGPTVLNRSSKYF